MATNVVSNSGPQVDCMNNMEMREKHISSEIESYLNGEISLEEFKKNVSPCFLGKESIIKKLIKIMLPSDLASRL